MSFGDWDRYSANVNNPALDFEPFGGQSWGAPILHAALVNPLSGVGQGDYLRRFALGPYSGLNRAGTVFASIGAGVAGGVFVGPDETHAQEARAWMRCDDPLPATNQYGAGVAMGGRWTHSVTSTAGGERWGARGYFASFGTAAPGDGGATGQGVLAARMHSSNGAGAFPSTYKTAVALLDPATGAAWLREKWYRFRWRLVPTGLAQDDMTLDRLVDGGDESDEGDWLSVLSMTVSPTLDPAYYCAPGAGTRYGFAASTGNNGSTPSLQPYIDLVSFRDTTV
jgi:hypothetical protein